MTGTAKTRPARITPIMCNTLGRDDVRLAEYLLENRPVWTDPAPVKAAQDRLARWLGLDHAFGFMGGRAALFHIAKALDLSEGDQVILPGLTCQVVVNAFEYNGVECVHADIETETFNMDAAQMVKKITPKTRAVLLQHTFGVPARDTPAIVAAARAHNLVVIEDVAHGLGGRLRGKKLGTFGDVAFFSSERTKMINTIHGGFAASSDPLVCRRLKRLHEAAALPDEAVIERLLNTLLFCYYTKVHKDRASLGPMALEKYGGCLMPQMTEFEFKGRFEPMYALKMPGAVGELALNQLKKFESFIPLRQAAAEKWGGWAREMGYRTASPPADSYCTWLRYPVLVPAEKKRDTRWIETELNMEPGVWFQTPCHPNPRPIPDIPNGWRVAETIINLPTGLWVR